MVSAVHGSLLTVEIPVKQYILYLNENMAAEERFVILDLDETHLLVQPHRAAFVEEEVKKFTECNKYIPPKE